jgi:hypothetical protein
VSKPLAVKADAQKKAAAWHHEVFTMFGGPRKICALCQKPGATDAAHVVGRGTKLGPLRYASPRLGRPLHRLCHEKVDRHEIDWPLDMRIDATLAHNEIAKVKLQVPDA